MRNWIIGAAAALAVVAAPSVAAAQATGYAGVVYNNTDFGGGADFDSYGVEGAVAFAGSGSIVFEVDAALLDSDDADLGYGLVGHVYARNSDHLFGGFVGVSGNDDSETVIAGVEANKYFASWTLGGAVFYGNNNDFDVDGWGANVEARAFLTDNTRLQANIGWVSVDSGGGGDDDAMIYGIGAEHQFDALPISVALGYANIDFDGGDADTISVAVRYNWGGTLRDRDRNGASQASIVGVGAAFAS